MTPITPASAPVEPEHPQPKIIHNTPDAGVTLRASAIRLIAAVVSTRGGENDDREDSTHREDEPSAAGRSHRIVQTWAA